MDKALTWIGGGVVAILAIYGLLTFFGINLNSGRGYAGVSWSQTGCNCDNGSISPAEQNFLRSVYK